MSTRYEWLNLDCIKLPFSKMLQRFSSSHFSNNIPATFFGALLVKYFLSPDQTIQTYVQ